MPRLFPAILLPGSVVPAAVTYGNLLDVLASEADARTKELELYRRDEPPAGYSLGVEVDGILREADAAGWERFHLVGYSGGGSAALAFTERFPDRVLSLALLEPAWVGWTGLSGEERALWDEYDELAAAPPEQLMSGFVGVQLRPGVEPPAPRDGPQPAWMASRPAGIRAILAALRNADLDHAALGRFDRPVYYALGRLSNPVQFERQAERLAGVFRDFTLETFEERHHFDPPHRVEPGRVAASLLGLWRRGER